MDAKICNLMKRRCYYLVLTNLDSLHRRIHRLRAQSSDVILKKPKHTLVSQSLVDKIAADESVSSVNAVLV